MIHGKGTTIEFTDELMYADGTPVQVIRFANEMDVLSSAIYNGGRVRTTCILIMQVPKDYMSDDPHHDVQEVIDILALPKETIGLMTAAEVEYVFNVTHHSHEGREAYAAVTAGLSNQVVAGDVLVDWESRHKVSVGKAMRLYGERGPPRFHAGTINTVAVLDVPLTLAGKANAMIAATEAKTAAMNIMGFRETGTTSDAVAIVSPVGEDSDYAGTGSYAGIAMCKAVRDAVCRALIIRDDFPEGTDDGTRRRIRAEYGL